MYRIYHIIFSWEENNKKCVKVCETTVENEFILHFYV